MDEKDIEYLQGLLKIPSVGARGVNAICEEVKKKKVKHTTTKLKQALHEWAKIKEWYESRETNTQKVYRLSYLLCTKHTKGYHSFTPGRPKQQFQID